MDEQTILIGLGCLGATLVAGSLYPLLGPRRRVPKNYRLHKYQHPMSKDNHDGLSTKLSDISGIWTGRTAQVDFREIAKIWRPPAVTVPEGKKRKPFSNPDVEAFWVEVVEPRQGVKADARAVLVRILETLQAEGGCPSVVNRTDQEPESRYDKDVYQALSSITLIEHSLRVARLIVSRAGQALLVSDALIAALAHDLGKIPRFIDKLHKTGDHSLISLVALGQYQEFATLPGKQEIEDIIRQHHFLKPSNPLAVALKEADQAARHEEIGLTFGASNDPTRSSSAEQQEEDDNGGWDVPTQSASPHLAEQASSDEPPVQQEVAQKHEDPEPLPIASALKAPAPITAASSAKPKPAAASPTPPAEDSAQSVEVQQPRQASDQATASQGFIDPAALLSRLLLRINAFNEKGQWEAISMNNPDLIYIQQGALLECLRETSDDPRILQAQADEQSRRKLILEAVSAISAYNDGVATDYIRPGFSTTQATVIIGKSKTLRLPLVPLRSTAFLPNTSFADLHKTKSPKMCEMVKKIIPAAGKENS
ncbi:HD domain-containing protein [Geoalkalibacter halelectricus]|uniref:HD domain-containing protein n=1 Tax=Geoalkalibacter halelectricus TaxID=2847045 RepID=UPI00266EBE07|nr:HD domain-containing protein [Geoalkalibacter halelectricus]MDO3380372.1 HD domain-containing protein [Geoalkalibacter halelectricus]